jgi:acyl carrier protein
MEPTLEEISRMTRIQLGLKSIDPDARLVEDLRAESADLLNLVAAVEDRFNVTIEEEVIPELQTARELFHYVVDQFETSIFPAK